MTGEPLILHHYDASPFSQKVRMLLGLKRLDWASVRTPDRLPKPDLVPLTGGYRRAPVMQIGADIFLDSALILAEIERRWPGHDRGATWPVNWWADRSFFQTTVVVLFGAIGDRVDPGFVADREALSGRPFDLAGMSAAAAPARAAWRAHCGWIEAALADAPFFGGAEPAIADVAAYMNVWFLASALPELADALGAGMDRLGAWRGRMAAIGTGERREMAGAEALTIAARAQPVAVHHDAADPSGLSPGDAVTLAADDYGRDPVAGTLVALTPERIVVARDTGDLGRLHVHAPRHGYVVAAARNS